MQTIKTFFLLIYKLFMKYNVYNNVIFSFVKLLRDAIKVIKYYNIYIWSITLKNAFLPRILHNKMNFICNY